MSQTIYFTSQTPNLDQIIDCACNTTHYMAPNEHAHEAFLNNKTGEFLSIDKKGLTEEQQKNYYETVLYNYWGQAALKVLEKREPDIHSRPAIYQHNQFRFAMQDTAGAVNGLMNVINDLGPSGILKNEEEIIKMIEAQGSIIASEKVENVREVVKTMLSSNTSFEALYNLTHQYYDFNKTKQTKICSVERSAGKINFSALPVKTKEQSRQM